MSSLVRPDPTAKGGTDHPDAGAGTSLNILSYGIHRLENVIKIDAAADSQSIILRVDIDVSEEAEIDSDGPF